MGLGGTTVVLRELVGAGWGAVMRRVLLAVGTGGTTRVWLPEGRYEGETGALGLLTEYDVVVTAAGHEVTVTFMVEVLVVGIGAMAEKVRVPVG